MSNHLSKLTAAAALGAAGAGNRPCCCAGNPNSSSGPAQGPPGPAAGRLPHTPSGANSTKTPRASTYTSGNYEAFARPEKPAGVEDKQAWIVGSGLAALAAACFLVRDGQMPGDHIHILGGHGRGRRGLRRHLRPHPGLHHAGRPGDGGPL